MFKRSLPLLLLLAATAHAQQTPTPAAAEWWRLTTALSNDSMQGRDTGTEAYDRAAQYVADQFKAARLLPAGDNGTYFQRVPMHQISLIESRSSLTILHPTGEDTHLSFNTDVATTPRGNVTVDGAALVFVGYGSTMNGVDLHGKIAIYFNSIPANVSPAERESFATRRLASFAVSGAVAALAIDNLSSIEPPHWPAAYSRSVTLLPAPARVSGVSAISTIRLNPASLGALLHGDATPEHAAARLLSDGARGVPLPTFALDLKANLHIVVEEKDIVSSNILAVFPGADARRATAASPPQEYVALSAHLDGYGLGTPVNGDRLYNGALDDAAYVATLLEFAHNLQAYAPKRSLLYCIFTGEEKGLLGSQYFTQHLTVPRNSIVADLNLDQLRPIFPLNILTMEGLNDSTLGDTARTLAAKYQIELRPDREPERNLFRRADNYSFVKIGVPIASFIFGYNPGSEEERLYRDWYARRYHKPQDDLSTPIDWAAAVKFNNFYTALALAVANEPNRPTWSIGSPYAPVKVALNSMQGCTAHVCH